MVEIAHRLNVPLKQLERMAASNALLRETMQMDRDAPDTAVMRVLHAKALAGDVRAGKYWLNNRSGWSENPKSQMDLKEQQVRVDKMIAETKEKTTAVAVMASKSVIPDGVWRAMMNPVYAEHLTDDRPVQIYYGGSSSGKSYAIIGQRTIRDVIRGERNYLICRKTARTLRHSCFNEVKKAIYTAELENHFSINKSDMVITHIATGSQILFCGLDDVEKIKSITPSRGVITDIIIEEATEADYDDYKGLIKRLRGGSEATVKRMVLLFNPILQDHWIYENFFAGKWSDEQTCYSGDELLILKTTYKANRYLTEDDRQKLENENDKYYYNVYTLGNWGILGNLIYTNWSVADLSDTRKKWAKYHNGLDFGFYPDPAAFVRVGYDKRNKTVYIFSERGGRHYTNEDLAAAIRHSVRQEVVTCDSSEPKSIQELNNLKIAAVPAVKGAGSVEFGIKWLQRQTIIVDAACRETISELRKYKYQEDRNGHVLPKPVDRDNHYLDALRYALEAAMVEVNIR